MMMCCITLNHGWHDVTVRAARARGALIARFSWHCPCSVCLGRELRDEQGFSGASLPDLNPSQVQGVGTAELNRKDRLGSGWTSLGQVWVWAKHRGMGRSRLVGVSPLLPPGWQRSCRVLPHGLASLGSPVVSGEGGSSGFKFLRHDWRKEWLLLSGLSAALHSDKIHDTRCQ